MSPIFKLNKNKVVFQRAGWFAVLAALAASFYVYEYAQYAKVKHEIDFIDEEIVRLTEENAILKQEYFSLTDPSRLREVAESEGMILDRRPAYLTFNR